MNVQKSHKSHKNSVIKHFVCDCCGKIKTGTKHKIYDENFNIQRGCYECDNCYGNKLNPLLADEEILANNFINLNKQQKI